MTQSIKEYIVSHPNCTYDDILLYYIGEFGIDTIPEPKCSKLKIYLGVSLAMWLMQAGLAGLLGCVHDQDTFRYKIKDQSC